MQKDYFLAEIVIHPGATRKFFTGEGWYGIVLLSDNDCLADWGKQAQRCNREDVLLMQPGRQLTLQPRAAQQSACVVWLCLSEPALTRLSDEQTDLLRSMRLVPFGCTAVHAGGQTTMLARNLAHRLNKERDKQGFGSTILEQGLLAMLLVLILRRCIAADFQNAERERPRFMVDDVFVYLREHLAQELSLVQLEKVFFVSHEHIAREFKKQTGQTVHRYLLSLRLEQSCRLLLSGQPAARIWQACGFSSYSYFFQAFRREVGMTPGQYAKTSLQPRADRK